MKDPEFPIDRRFYARVVSFAERVQRRASAVPSVAAALGERHLVWSDYLTISRRRRSNRIPLLKLQLHLLEDLAYTQEVIRAIKSEQSRIQEDLKTGSITEDDANVLLHDLDGDLLLRDTERRTLRDIGDGIAWRMLDYDRASIYLMADRADAGNIEQEGLLAELQSLSDAIETERCFAVLNSVTHLLKHGDLTIKRNENEFEIQEVKTRGKTSGRITRQKQALSRLAQFLSTRQGEHREVRASIRELSVTPAAFADRIAEIIRRASRDGHACAQVDDSIIVDCIDLLVLADRRTDKRRTAAEAAAALYGPWQQRNDFFTRTLSVDKYEQIRSYAPFSIYPFDSDTCIGLCAGSIAVAVYVNLSSIERYFEAAGWEIVRTVTDHLNDAMKTQSNTGPVLTVGKLDRTIGIPAGIMGRIGCEYLKIKSVRELCDRWIEAEDTSDGAVLLRLSGESRQWN